MKNVTIIELALAVSTESFDEDYAKVAKEAAALRSRLDNVVHFNLGVRDVPVKEEGPAPA